MQGLTEFPLPGENGDRGFMTMGGLRFRVRLRRTDSDFAKPAPGIDPDMTAPTKMTLSVSVALLDADNAVATMDGKLRIFDRHEILVSDDNMANPAYDLQSVVEKVIAENIANAATVVPNQAASLAYLADAWNVDGAGAANPAMPE